jgi:hypothetical protein
MAQFAITYEEFVARATERYGQQWAAEHCPEYGRGFARDCRQRAATVSPADAEALRRVADRMDPDLRAGAA